MMKHTAVQKRPSTHLQDRLFPMNFSRMMDELFNTDISERAAVGAHFFTPQAEVKETEESFLLNLALPGISKTDISIELKGEELVITGTREEQKNTDHEKLHLSEFTYGRFSRSFYLPESVNKDAVEAEFKDGILSISLPKMEARKPKSVSIK